MSSSEGCVGGVEPETVERYLVWVCGGCEICKPLDGSPGRPMPCTHEAPSVDGAYVVEVEAYDAVVDRLRLVEEELREERYRWKACAALDVTETTFKTWTICRETGDRAVRGECPVHGGDGCLVVVAPVSVVRSAEEELRQARGVAANMKAHYEEALSNRDRAIDSIRADRDRLARAIEAHREAVIGHETPADEDRALYAALSPVQGEHEQDGEDAGVYCVECGDADQIVTQRLGAWWCPVHQDTGHIEKRQVSDRTASGGQGERDETQDEPGAWVCPGCGTSYVKDIGECGQRLPFDCRERVSWVPDCLLSDDERASVRNDDSEATR